MPRSVSRGIPRYLNAIEDPVYTEVEALLTSFCGPPISDDLRRAEILQAVFGVACDRTTTAPNSASERGQRALNAERETLKVGIERPRRHYGRKRFPTSPITVGSVSRNPKKFRNSNKGRKLWASERPGPRRATLGLRKSYEAANDSRNERRDCPRERWSVVFRWRCARLDTGAVKKLCLMRSTALARESREVERRQ